MELVLSLLPALLVYLGGAIAVNPQNGVFVNGDLIIGGLVPVHLSPDSARHPGTATCKGDFHLRGYRGVEAMLFALELINNDPNLLPNISLGADIKDTCGSVDYAIMECLNFDFIKSVFVESDGGYCGKERDNSSVFNSSTNSLAGTNNSECCTRNKRTVAVVGAAFSGVTMAAAGLAGLFRVPVVSFSSTSRLLSDRARFGYFFRTVPSDELQAQAIVDILHFLEWRYIILVASDNEYGRSGVSALKQIIQHSSSKKDICIVVDELFSRRKDNGNEVQRIFDKIGQFPKAKVIVLYVEFPDARYFLEKAKSAGLKDYMFIASDSWAGSLDAVKGAGNVISTVIGLRPPSPKVRNFNKYFYKKLRDRNSHTWTKECNDSLTCDGDIETECYTGIHQNGYVSYVIDAVFTIAHALHNMLHCSESACAKDWRALELRKLLADFIQNVTFRGISNKSIRFDPHGGANGLYDIYQFTGRKYKHLGHWQKSAKLALQIRNLTSLNGSFNGLPTSVCSRECDKGGYKIPIQQFPDCCWKCAKCAGRTFANTSGLTSCTECPPKTWPTADHTDCRKIEARYLSWKEGWAVAITCISLIGCVAVMWTMLVLQRYQRTAVVRASSRQLCHVLLIGILLFYVIPLVYIAKPSVLSCKLIPFLFGMCLVLVVGTIMIKTNRISRIFNDKLFQKGRSSCLGNRWQIIWLVCLLTIEIVTCFGWVYGTASVKPSPVEEYSENSKDASLVCDFTGSKVGFSLWLIYNAGLIVVCTYQAFLVRKVPQNYNESKFIAFSMTTLCITVLVFVPSYMGTSGWYRAVISCFLFIFLGSATWGSIFIPKLYIIYFRPHKNVPMRPASVSSITLGVILPSPSVVSDMSDLSRRSRSPSAGSDSNLERTDRNDIWDSSNLKSRDGTTENEACEGESRDHETSPERFADENTEMPGTKKNNRDCSCDKEDEKKEHKTSVVYFEDVVFVDDFSIPVQKPPDPQGILRRKILSSGDDTVVGHVMERKPGHEGKRSSLKRKTSSVRFSDQVTGEETSNKKQEHRKETGHKGADDSSDVKEAFNGHVKSSTNKRKMSVWCMEQPNEPKCSLNQ